MLQKKIRLGDLLIKKGYIDENDLKKALQIQKDERYRYKLGEIFVNEGYISEKELIKLLGNQLGIELVDIYGEEIDFDLLSKFSSKVLRSKYILPFKEDSEYIYVATADPLDYESVEMIERSYPTKPIKLFLALKDDISYVLDRLELIETTKVLINNVKKDITSGAYRSDNEQSSIMQLIEVILKNAILKNASDVHIEPNAFNVVVRARIDGVLRENFVFDLDIYNALASRIKILGNLDISEKRKSQDGRFSMKINGKDYDFRLSTAPVMFGESIVMRILDQQKILLKVNELGIEGKNLENFSELLKSPFGIVLVTGPTGSGKTTTLYAALNEIKSVENKMITIEDPIEYQLPLAQQIQINEKINYGFAEALRSILRQDPDIIMVGEVRDEETLNIAVQASLTGHLVFTTLHTNDAPSAITRMVQMGLPPYLISDSLVGVVAQRLVRKICPYCKKEHKLQKNVYEKLKPYLPKDYKVYLGTGCEKCSFSGYSGRILICEILQITPAISHMISIGMNKYEIAKKAEEEGAYRPMIYDGILKALEGITSIEEVLRVTRI